MAAPVCPLPDRTPPPHRPDLHSTPIPLATDLSSAIAAINALRAMVQSLSGQLQRQARSVPPGRQPPATTTVSVVTKKSNDDPKKKAGAWEEVSRRKEKIRVENPDDSSQFVMVEVINSITMRNKSTGELWTWKR